METKGQDVITTALHNANTTSHTLLSFCSGSTITPLILPGITRPLWRLKVRGKKTNKQKKQEFKLNHAFNAQNIMTNAMQDFMAAIVSVIFFMGLIFIEHLNIYDKLDFGPNRLF